MVHFENRRTVEQVKVETKSNKLFMFPAYSGHGADKKPLTYKDANGSDTGVQKYIVENEAGNAIGWCAMAVAKDLAQGKLNKDALAFVDSVDDDGFVYANKLIYNNQRDGGIEL